MKTAAAQWYDYTVNPVIGCTNHCPYCHGERLNTEVKWIPDYHHPTFFHDQLNKLYTQKPARIFMNSMNDIADWRIAWTVETMLAIHANPQHQYLFLTKRPVSYIGWRLFEHDNIWCGFSIASGDDCPKEMRETMLLMPHANWFLEIELLHGPVDLKHELECGVKWIVMGAEAGPGQKSHLPVCEWMLDIVSQADRTGVPVFMKDSLKEVIPPARQRKDFPAQLAKASKPM